MILMASNVQNGINNHIMKKQSSVRCMGENQGCF
jgi:hypothetical protein